MTLLAKLNNDRTAARLANNQKLISLLTTLVSEAAAPGFNDGKRQSTDTEVIKVIKRFRDNSEITLNLLKQNGGTAERIADTTFEIQTLEAYLPTMMTDDELREAITKAVKETRDANLPATIGSIMAVLRTNHAGLYDGAKAKTFIVSLL